MRERRSPLSFLSSKYALVLDLRRQAAAIVCRDLARHRKQITRTEFARRCGIAVGTSYEPEWSVLFANAIKDGYICSPLKKERKM